MIRDIRPRKVTVTLATNPGGLQLRLDGQPVATPHSFVSVVGIERTLEAVSPQGHELDFLVVVGRRRPGPHDQNPARKYDLHGAVRRAIGGVDCERPQDALRGRLRNRRCNVRGQAVGPPEDGAGHRRVEDDRRLGKGRLRLQRRERQPHLRSVRVAVAILRTATSLPFLPSTRGAVTRRGLRTLVAGARFGTFLPRIRLISGRRKKAGTLASTGPVSSTVDQFLSARQ